jgi:hypothetical protein
MKRDVRSLAHLILLVTTLAVVLWLADTAERGTLPWRRPEDETTLAPIISPPGGNYDESLLVEMAPSRRDAVTIFATGGHVPTLTVGTLYERPLLLDAGAPGVTVVRAREVVGDIAGPVVSASYAVGVEHALPILSIAADPRDLWDPTIGLFPNTWQRGDLWERPVHVTYIDGDQVVEMPAGLRIHGSELFDTAKQSLRLYFRSEYGTPRLEYDLFPDHPMQDVQSYKRLLLQAGDLTGRWTLLEEQLLSEVAAEIGGHVTQGRYVLLFINGESWGIYRLGERVDRFFLQDNLGIRSADFIRGGDIEAGDPAQWDGLLTWLSTHDLSDEANFEAVAAQIDLDDFTDYAILQTYFGFPADRFSAVRPHGTGGRWFWLYGGWRRTWAMESNPETVLAPADDPEDLAFLLQKLLENPDYRGRFARRAADLLNTTLAPEMMTARVDRLAAVLRPDADYESARWPTPTSWERNIAALRDLVQQRPNAVREEVTAALELSGTAELTFDAQPREGGRVFVSGLSVDTLPRAGTFFRGSEVEIIAVPAEGYVFDGWETAPGESTPGVTLTVEGPRAIVARFTTRSASDPVLRPNDVIISEIWINDNGTRYPSLDDRPIEGDWLELLVSRSGGVDLRGWRITDNDTKIGSAEGSLIMPQIGTLASVPQGTTILIVVTQSRANTAHFSEDDLDPSDGQMALYTGNGHLDVMTDPGFAIGTGDDNVVLLAPGPTSSFADNVGVDFVAEGSGVTPYSFGVLADGVVFENPFRRLGTDDGAFFVGPGANDDGASGWVVDPGAGQTGDAGQLDTVNWLTPGTPNRRPGELSFWGGGVWLMLIGFVDLVALSLLLHRRRRQ